MRSIATRGLTLLIALVLAAGCSGSEPNTPAAGGTTATPAPVEGASIAVSPAETGCSPEGVYTGIVTWRVAEASNVIITVGPAGPDGTLFVESRGDSGRHETGPWVVPGLRFTLADPDGAVLATTDAGPGDCAQESGTG